MEDLVKFKKGIRFIWKDRASYSHTFHLYKKDDTKKYFSNLIYLSLEEEERILGTITDISALLKPSQIRLNNKEFEIFEYVIERYEEGKMPIQKEIEKEFKISKNTVQKRINILINKGLIDKMRKGRCNYHFPTPKGHHYYKNKK
jgi:DNA-binding MarR family transcriptional regulator